MRCILFAGRSVSVAIVSPVCTSNAFKTGPWPANRIASSWKRRLVTIPANMFLSSGP